MEVAGARTYICSHLSFCDSLEPNCVLGSMGSPGHIPVAEQIAEIELFMPGLDS